LTAHRASRIEQVAAERGAAVVRLSSYIQLQIAIDTAHHMLSSIQKMHPSPCDLADHFSTPSGFLSSLTCDSFMIGTAVKG
jgi:hypothetical protein